MEKLCCEIERLQLIHANLAGTEITDIRIAKEISPTYDPQVSILQHHTFCHKNFWLSSS